MNKKTLIILGSIVFIVLFTMAILSIVNSRKAQIQKANELKTGTMANGQSGQLPSQAVNQSPSQMNGNTSAKTSPDISVRVKDGTNASQIKDSYAKYIDQSLDDYPAYVKVGISYDYPVNDSSGKIVPISTFLNAIDAKINPKMKELVGSNYYGLFYCINDKKEKEYGIALDVGSEDSGKLKSYNSQVKDSLAQWEPDMLKDLHNILYPDANLDDKTLNQKLVFRNGTFRYADFILSNNNTSINYTVKDSPINRVYISTSQSCLQKALAFLFDT